jgi:hypothetical protein
MTRSLVAVIWWLGRSLTSKGLWWARHHRSMLAEHGVNHQMALGTKNDNESLWLIILRKLVILLHHRTLSQLAAGTSYLETSLLPIFNTSIKLD